MTAEKHFDTIIDNIGQLLTMDHGDHGDGPLKGEEMSKLEVSEHAALAIRDGLVAWIGTHEEAQSLKATERIDAEGKLVTPGLVDPHTHLVFGGSPNHTIPVPLMMQRVSYDLSGLQLGVPLAPMDALSTQPTPMPCIAC